MSAISVVAGIDVAKAHVDVDVVGAAFTPQRFANEAEGHTAVAAALKSIGVGLVVLEATGGYEATLACALQGAGLVVAFGALGARDFASDLVRAGEVAGTADGRLGVVDLVAGDADDLIPPWPEQAP